MVCQPGLCDQFLWLHWVQVHSFTLISLTFRANRPLFKTFALSPPNPGFYWRWHFFKALFFLVLFALRLTYSWVRFESSWQKESLWLWCTCGRSPLSAFVDWRVAVSSPSAGRCPCVRLFSSLVFPWIRRTNIESTPSCNHPTHL